MSVKVEFTPLTYDVLQVGETFVSDDHLVTPEDIETYAFAVDDHHPWFFEASPFGGPVAHPTLLGNQALRLRHTRYVVHAGLHARMDFQFLEPIRPGMRVRSRGTVVDKYERRGKPYMVTEFVTEDEDGAVLVRGQFTQMLFRD
jgi:acyl dehydratase